MKGLLLKDFYMAWRYCRVFLIIIVVFLALSMVGSENVFFLVYPMMASSIIPVTLMGYDERDKWLTYSGTLPYTRAQLVSAKYLVGLCFGGVSLLLSMAATWLRMQISRTFSWEELAVLGVVLVVMTCLCPVVLFPFSFKYGVEKGRFAYYITIGLCCGVGAVLASSGFQVPSISGGMWLLVVVVAVALALYALSWWLSIRFYQRREL